MDTARVFTCRRCGGCCRGDGGIFITTGEAEEAGRVLNLDPEGFIRLYTEIRHGLLSLKTGDDGWCLLRDMATGGCRIHAVKPVMCRDWPFFQAPLLHLEAFQNIKNFCPGINPEATWDDFKKFHRIYIKNSPPPSHLYYLLSHRD